MTSRSTREGKTKKVARGTKKKKNPLIADRKGGMPVGRGGRDRERSISDAVDRAQTGY